MEFPPDATELKPRFDTGSGKFEFYLLSLDRKIAEYARRYNLSPDKVQQVLAERYGIKLQEDLSHLPHYEPPRFTGRAEEYPFYLRPFQIITLWNGEGANRPLLIEMAGYLNFVRWNSWAEINKRTAGELGIKDGDWIWIESPAGKVKTQAKITPTAMPGVISIPYGLGHWAYGRYAQGRGVNPNDVLALESEPISGHLSRHAMRVKVYPAVET